jgi:hypothetical protein
MILKSLNDIEDLAITILFGGGTAELRPTTKGD